MLLFVHPYLIYPITLRWMKRRPVAPGQTLPQPSASLLFSAYNEEASLPDKIRNLEEIRKICPDVEFVAYSDMSSDRTREIIESRSDLIRFVPSSERTGKATGMRHMVASCSSDICIFTDANVILDPATVPALLNYFRDPTIGGVSGTLKYINDDEGTTAQVGGFYWRLEEKIKKLESECGSMMGADGSIFATRRSIYPVVPAHLLDDMTVSMSVTFEGLRLISAPDVVAYEKNTTSSSDEFRRKRRIACRAFNTHKHLWPSIDRTYSLLDRYKYVSHKLLRWFGAPMLALSAIFFSVALCQMGLSSVVVASLGLAVVLWLLARKGIGGPLVTLYEVLTQICATFMGIIDSWSGKTYQIWSPAKSR
ncbi:cellulose synthase/poly-beta-1,6-N-acetylglucosamine synthase-like glycosyltransferase [Novosphingobium sp. SG751A]|uniref:glycosyltransferase n=1 Tax=Novosphingobium sp. SG751A TaxID=2587000 RepID=UPI001551CD56|nr:glycosyltransferase [Novosphingobium sp. SG751A]NOW45602.1 cellulose synthase/poly-beta-1,6-N-acetylglucosamine synthase-like glycosyltransferase [Novosphingobium sp. SG751A]